MSNRLPAHQAMGIDPAQGGGSLLHDEHGIPKVSQGKRSRISPAKNITNTPIDFKAQPQQKLQMWNGAQKNSIPRGKFVNVGVNEEHVWYPDSVTGPREKVPDERPYADQAYEEVDVEALQGYNPLQEPSEEGKAFILRLSNTIDKIENILQDISSEEDLSEFKSNIFSKSGPIANLVNSYSSDIREEVMVEGNNLIERMYSIFQDKELQFSMAGDTPIAPPPEVQTEDFTESESTESSEYLVVVDGMVNVTGCFDEAKGIFLSNINKSPSIYKKMKFDITFRE
jgi:hypothetical protein